VFEKYNERARRVIFFARYETSQHGGNEIEVEHLLFGLMREDKNLARYLNQSVMSFDAIRKELEAQMPPQPRVAVVVDLPLSAAATRVLDLAANESEAMGHSYIGPEHLLLGVLSEGDSAAAKALASRGVELLSVRADIIRRSTNESRPETVRQLSESWVPAVAQAVRETSWFRSPELSEEMNQSGNMRQLLSVEAESLLRVLAAHGLADGRKLIALATELEDLQARKRFIDRIREDDISDEERNLG
jgi:ATP-dependent Clp protease ATP-binding subunit ClpC